jgi:hypothetical protein
MKHSQLDVGRLGGRFIGGEWGDFIGIGELHGGTGIIGPSAEDDETATKTWQISAASRRSVGGKLLQKPPIVGHLTGLRNNHGSRVERAFPHTAAISTLSIDPTGQTLGNALNNRKCVFVLDCAVSLMLQFSLHLLSITDCTHHARRFSLVPPSFLPRVY